MERATEHRQREFARKIESMVEQAADDNFEYHESQDYIDISSIEQDRSAKKQTAPKQPNPKKMKKIIVVNEK